MAIFIIYKKTITVRSTSSLDGQIIGVFRQLCKHTASRVCITVLISPNYLCVLMRLSYVDTATTMRCLFSLYNLVSVGSLKYKCPI